jgi:uncharacterized protein (DUF885 family)
MRLLAAAVAAFGVAHVFAATPLQELFDTYWEDTARRAPEFATFRGDTRYGDRFSDRSPEGIAAQDAYFRELQRKVRAVDRAGLSQKDRVSVEMLQRTADDAVLLSGYKGFTSMTISAAPFAFQGFFAQLARVTPVENVAQVEQFITRMERFPARVDQEIASLKRGKAAGWVPTQASVKTALAQIDGQIVPADKSPLLDPFSRLGAAIPDGEREKLRARAVRAIDTHVVPALRRLREYAGGEYLAAAPEEGGLSRYPGGAEVYAAAVRIHTTTNLTPRQIHDIGLAELKRLRAEMESVMRETGFQGDFAAFIRYLNTDPRFFYANGDEMLDGYRVIAKRIDPELPRLFAELPRAPYGVRAMPAFVGPDAAESYTAPSIDGLRAGYFNANALAFKSRPKWVMEALMAHEGVPGHHLQTARGMEMKDLPLFRRNAFQTAYLEGWATYSETLGSELGLYKDPYSRFGALQFQAWRAARLVVDTGVHAFGWKRRQAIDFMVERTGLDEPRVTSEVDRYYSWPGQALAYMIGALKIRELRDRALAALGDRFDVRRFHMVVLDSGAVPLDVLDQLVNDWIASQR